jgi:hypothetical protein
MRRTVVLAIVVGAVCLFVTGPLGALFGVAVVIARRRSVAAACALLVAAGAAAAIATLVEAPLSGDTAAVARFVIERPVAGFAGSLVAAGLLALAVTEGAALARERDVRPDARSAQTSSSA